MSRKVETLKELVFGGARIISINDEKAAEIMQKGKLTARIYNITSPDRLNFEIYKVYGMGTGEIYIIDHEDYAE